VRAALPQAALPAGWPPCVPASSLQTRAAAQEGRLLLQQQQRRLSVLLQVVQVWLTPDCCCFATPTAPVPKQQTLLLPLTGVDAQRHRMTPAPPRWCLQRLPAAR